MSNYYFDKNTFVIRDFQNQKTFSSFFPAVSGLDGKPLWVFYCNRGQGIASFGVDNKNTPIIPFDSANLAYQNIALKSFRTFLKINGEYYEPFFDLNNVDNEMRVDKNSLSIEENNKFNLNVSVNYTTISHKDYPALIRKVALTNKSNKDMEIEILDGLPIFFPYGLSNIAYKETVSLMGAYCEIEGFDEFNPLVKFKTSTGDCSLVSKVQEGNGFVTISEDKEKFINIVDPYVVFKNDLTLIKPLGFIGSLDITKEENQLENKLPCAFSYKKVTIKKNESFTFYTLFGKFNSISHLRLVASGLSKNFFEDAFKESATLIDELLEPIQIETKNYLFNEYIKQSFLDNNLRGGFPVKLSDDEVYYCYGRKHGDMERDYNFFNISSTYYSCGAGNFRDVNQNRRNDLYFYPFVKDYNIKLFFDLIQLDGQNPLLVKPMKFYLNKDADVSTVEDEKLLTILKNGFLPGELYAYLKDEKKCLNPIEQFKSVLKIVHQEEEAAFAEGYWIDHWTYNVDLLESYNAIYPDKIKELLLRDDYKYFTSYVYVEPRYEKYCLLDDGRVRQYGAINLDAAKKLAEAHKEDLNKTRFVTGKDGETYKTTLLSKIFNLCLIKFSTLDNEQMGIEMECEKPGWNDAMNGLPGLFSSSVGETVELYRLMNFLTKNAYVLKDESIKILKEQYDFFNGVVINLNYLDNQKISSFEYWDNVTSLREEFRKKTKETISNKEVSIKVSTILSFLEDAKSLLLKGINKAKDINRGIVPSYLIYEVSKYDETSHTNFLGYKTVTAKEFVLKNIPMFIEGSARYLKLGKKLIDKDVYTKIKHTGLYDKELKMYKTCDGIEDEPFEIGRVHAFTRGWLERECNFLHMGYKYLLGLLKGGLYEEFFKEIKTNLVYNLNPDVYGRSPLENSSFIVPTCNPDKLIHGRGYFARLTGANAEMLDIYINLLVGEQMFKYENGELILNIDPLISKEFFDENKEIKFTLFNKLNITLRNPKRIDAYKKKGVKYIINNKKYDEVKNDLALQIRNLEIREIIVEIK